jgi:hypothetical protein
MVNAVLVHGFQVSEYATDFRSLALEFLLERDYADSSHTDAGFNHVGVLPSQNKTAKELPLAIVPTAETPVVKAGSSVSVNGRLTNTSRKPLDPSGRYCGPSGLDSYLTWEVRDDKGRLAAKRVYPHPELATSSAILDRIVKPGDSLAGSQDIGRRRKCHARRARDAVRLCW